MTIYAHEIGRFHPPLIVFRGILAIHRASGRVQVTISSPLLIVFLGSNTDLYAYASTQSTIPESDSNKKKPIRQKAVSYTTRHPKSYNFESAIFNGGFMSVWQHQGSSLYLQENIARRHAHLPSSSYAQHQNLQWYTYATAQYVAANRARLSVSQPCFQLSQSTQRILSACANTLVPRLQGRLCDATFAVTVGRDLCMLVMVSLVSAFGEEVYRV
jgi:hypothetical protein